MDDERQSAAFISVDLHPAQRWSALVGMGLCCSNDLPTISAWARQGGTCETQLRMRWGMAEDAAARAFVSDWLAKEKLVEPMIYPLEKVADAQRDMEAGRTTGKVVFQVGG